MVLQEGEGTGWSIEDWSDDESRVLISQYISVNESRLYEMDRGHRRAAPAAARRHRRIRGNPLRPCPERLLHLGHERRVQAPAPARPRERRDRGADGTTHAWDVESFAVSRDRKRLAYVLNEDGVSRLFARSLVDGAFIALPPLPRGIVSGLRFHPDSSRLGFTLRSATTPSDVFSIDFRHPRAHAMDAQRTRRNRREPARRTRTRPLPDIRRSVHSRRSSTARKGPGPHPVIVSIHGGPESQSRPSFSSTTQYYVNELGAAVIYPNVRGSRGYGKTWLKARQRPAPGGLRPGHRRAARLDRRNADLDADRVAVTGGSYGGYMVLASVVHYGDRSCAPASSGSASATS